MNTKPLSRFVHQAFPGRNRLATTGDRLEGAVLVAAFAVVLLAVPIVGATGSEIYATQKTRSVEQVGTRQQVDAVLTEDAPPTIGSTERGGVVEAGPVMAVWRLPNGMARQGTVQAHYDAKAGAKVPIWIDGNGDQSDSPLTLAGAAINAVALALLLWGAIAGTMALLYLVVRLVHQRMRLRKWELEWAEVSGDWSGRS